MYVNNLSICYNFEYGNCHHAVLLVLAFGCNQFIVFYMYLCVYRFNFMLANPATKPKYIGLVLGSHENLVFLLVVAVMKTWKLPLERVILTSFLILHINGFIYFKYFHLICLTGMKKSYWITCNVEPDIQHLSLDRRRFPSNLIVRPRDLTRLLANFQSSLQEITIIATETTSLPPDVASEIGGKAVELRSYIDPTKGTQQY